MEGGGVDWRGSILAKLCPVDWYMQEGSWVTTGLSISARIGQVLSQLGLFTGKWFLQRELVKW